jgi:uncharacterized iron-regulated membrane protein
VTVRSDPRAPVELNFGRERTLFVDPYTAEVLGQSSPSVRSFFRTVTEWHRWFGAQGQSRAAARAITGACNLAFFFLVLSGMYLWLPKRWTWQHLKPILLFRGKLSGKARDFNWHNVVGIWSAVPLVMIIVSGVVMSYPWANNLIYRMTGTEPPPLQRREGGPPRRQSGQGRNGPERQISTAGVDRAWGRAVHQVSDWKAITLRMPESDRSPLTFTIDEAHRGRPDKRSTLVLDRVTANTIRHETFADYNTGRRLRTWLRWMHTGEAGGILGQTIAGLASFGGAVLVWTGMWLAWRRLRAYLQRRSSAGAVIDDSQLVASDPSR